MTTGLVYRIKSLLGEKDGIPCQYYGSTKWSMQSRMSNHKTTYKKYLAGTGNKMSSAEVMQHPDAFIEVVEDNIPIVDLLKREGFYQLTEPCCNINIAGRTQKEWRDANKDKIKEHRAKYYVENKDKIDESNAEWIKNNPMYFKDYYESNKEHLDDYYKKYRETNRAKYNAKYYSKIACTNCSKMITKLNMPVHMKKLSCINHDKPKPPTTITCDCGKIVNKRYLKKHQKTKTCINNTFVKIDTLDIPNKNNGSSTDKCASKSEPSEPTNSIIDTSTSEGDGESKEQSRGWGACTTQTIEETEQCEDNKSPS
jgi:hypothetical protein